MKVLINCNLPFALAHGGQQIQVERTLAALQSIGVEAEPLRWWDDRQSAQIIHYFGRMPALHIELAHQRGFKVVMGELLTAPGSRPGWKLTLHRLLKNIATASLPAIFIQKMDWDSYRLADVIVAMTPWEKHLMHYLFGAPLERMVIVPNGVEEVFLQAPPTERGPWLVCTATITPRKRVLELARAAVRAQTPVWFVGKAYTESDPYAREFYALAKEHPQLIRCESPAMEDRAGLARIYRAARGFVLLSAMETRSLAAEEAAACECPLLLSDLPWARSTFEEHARYCPVGSAGSAEGTAQHLRRFYDDAPALKPPPKPPTWTDVARQLKTTYERLLSTSR